MVEKIGKEMQIGIVSECVCGISLGKLERFDSTMIARVLSCSCVSMLVGPAPCNIARTEEQLKNAG